MTGAALFTASTSTIHIVPRKASTFIRSTTEIASDLLKGNREYVLAQLNEGLVSLKDVKKEFLVDPDIRQLGLLKNGLDLCCLSKETQTLDEVLIAFENNGMALQHVNSSYSDDYNALMLAVSGNGLALQFVDNALVKKDAEAYFKISLAAVRENGLAFQFCDQHLIKYTEQYFKIVKEAVKGDSLAIQFATHELQDNIDIANFAFRENPAAIQHVSERLYPGFKKQVAKNPSLRSLLDSENSLKKWRAPREMTL